MTLSLSQIEKHLDPEGFVLLGHFPITPEDQIPGASDNATLVLVGNAGPGMWRAFTATNPDLSSTNPLDEWTRSTLIGIAGDLTRDQGIRIDTLFPFDGPPYHPFQRWAAKSGNAFPTPIGPLLHPRYGLWHAYRGAFVINALIAGYADSTGPNPCQTCAERPCLNTCPVGAFSDTGYDVPACLDLLEKEPNSPCFTTGCEARRACPVGHDYIYEPPQARFHMEKFLAAHRP